MPGALTAAGADPEPQDVADPVDGDAHRDVDGPVGDLPVPDLPLDPVYPVLLIDAIYLTRLPRLHLLHHGVGDTRDKIPGHVVAVDVLAVGGDVAGGHAPGVEADDGLVEARQTACMLGHQRGLDVPARSRGTFTVTGPISVRTVLGE